MGLLVVTAVNDRYGQGWAKAIPKEEDAQKLDLVGEERYSVVRLQLHIANHQALLAQHDVSNGGNISVCKYIARML